LADAHSASERHLDAELLAALHQRRRAVEFDALVRDLEGDRAALAPFVSARDGEPFRVQLVPHTRCRPSVFDRVEHGGRTARPRGAVFPVRDEDVERAEVDLAHVRCQLQVQPVVGLGALQRT
jgi:hypothetical protein